LAVYDDWRWRRDDIHEVLRLRRIGVRRHWGIVMVRLMERVDWLSYWDVLGVVLHF
jgi:hypothetical protein